MDRAILSRMSRALETSAWAQQRVAVAQEGILYELFRLRSPKPARSFRVKLEPEPIDTKAPSGLE